MCINFTAKGDGLHVARVAVCSLLGVQDGHPPLALFPGNEANPPLAWLQVYLVPSLLVCSTDTPVIPVVPTHHQSPLFRIVHVRITYLDFPTFLYRMRQEAGRGLGLKLQVSHRNSCKEKLITPWLVYRVCGIGAQCCVDAGGIPS